MADLSTSYMGIPLKNPLVVAASSLSNHLDFIKKAEDVGAGALVIRSLFEEQVQLDRVRMANTLTKGDESFPEATSYFPAVKYGGPSEHLMWVERAVKAVKMPIFGSLNAVSPGAWIEYARQMEQTGVAGIELNIYAVATDPTKPASEIEKQLFDTVQAVREVVKVPLALKMSMFYTNPINIVHEVEKRGINAVVMFNRFLQPDIDPDTQTLLNEMVWSTPAEMKIPLRYVALLYGRTQCDIGLTTGVHHGRDVVKALLAGATIVQIAAALIKNGLPYLSTLLLQLQEWMAEHHYKSVNDFRGSLSQKNADDPFAFERAQYVRLLISQRP